jgi:hypothetical protein
MRNIIVTVKRVPAKKFMSAILEKDLSRCASISML